MYRPNAMPLHVQVASSTAIIAFAFNNSRALDRAVVVVGSTGTSVGY